MVVGIDASRVFAEQRTGTENYSYQLLRALGRIDRENKYLLFVKDGITGKQKEEFQEFSNFSFRVIKWPRLWTQGGLALATWFENLDLLFIPAHTLPVLRKPGIPTVVTIHGIEYEFLPEHYRIPQKWYLTWSTRYAVKFAKRLLAVSEFTKRELIKRLGASEKKIIVVHEGVDIEVYSKLYKDNIKHSALAELGIRKPYILFLGVIQPRKNLTRLIEAFSILINKYERLEDLELVIAGKKGWMYDEILAAPEKYTVLDRVKFVGFVKERSLPVVIKEAELYVQPSLSEGFGLPVLEAMAAGTPVVAANAGSLPEIVGDAGVLVEPLASSKMAEAMAAVLHSNDFKEKLRNKGRLRVKKFTWEAAARRTLILFEEVVRIERRK